MLDIYLVANALTAGRGWQDGVHNLWARISVLLLIMLVGWVLRRLHRRPPLAFLAANRRMIW